MARPREFESEAALKKAIEAFSEHGYEGTSTDALLLAMGISRQSMYGAFGDKKRLYLEALQRYTADSICNQLRILSSTSSPMKGLEAMLDLAVSLAIDVTRCVAAANRRRLPPWRRTSMPHFKKSKIIY